MATAFSLLRGQPLQAQGAPLSFLQGYFDMTVGEAFPDIIMGAGAPDGDASPFKEANKGSLYMRTDGSDDANCIYQKYDEGEDDDDWSVFGSFSGTHSASLTVGEDDTGYDVKFYGATSGSYWLWDESGDEVIMVGDHTQTGNSQLTGTFTVGVDDTGHDVKLFGATAGSFLLWDESSDQLELTDSTPLAFGDAADMVMQWDGTSFKISQATVNSAIELGVDGAGIDLKLFGDTASAYVLWDQSADEMVFAAGASIDMTAEVVMIDFKAGDASTVNPSAAAEDGWININVDGTKKYIPWYDAS